MDEEQSAVQMLAETFNTTPDRVTFYGSVILAVAGFLIFALSRRCGRCGSWFSMVEVGFEPTSSYPTPGRPNRGMAIRRCSVCGVEIRVYATRYLY